MFGRYSLKVRVPFCLLPLYGVLNWFIIINKGKRNKYKSFIENFQNYIICFESSPFKNFSFLQERENLFLFFDLQKLCDFSFYVIVSFGYFHNENLPAEWGVRSVRWPIFSSLIFGSGSAPSVGILLSTQAKLYFGDWCWETDSPSNFLFLFASNFPIFSLMPTNKSILF